MLKHKIIKTIYEITGIEVMALIEKKMINITEYTAKLDIERIDDVFISISEELIHKKLNDKSISIKLA